MTNKATHRLTLADVGGAVLVIAAATSTWSALPAIGPLPLSYWLMLLAFVLLLLDSFAGRVRVRTARWIWLPVVALVVLMLWHYLVPVSSSYLASRFVYFDAATIADANPVARGAQWMLLLAGLPLALTAAAAHRPQWVRRTVTGWLIGIAFSATIAILDFSAVSNISPSLTGIENASGRESGLTIHPNTLGISCAMAVPVALLVMTSRRWAGGLLIAMLLGGVVASGSRAAQLGALVVVVATLVCVRSSRRLVPPLVMLGLAFTLLIVVTSPGILADASQLLRFSADRSGTSDIGRNQLLTQGIADFAYSPFTGIGLEYLLFAHNVFVQLGAAGGLVLFVAVVVYWACAVVQGWRAAQTTSDEVRYYVMALVVFLGMGLASNQLIEAFLYYPVAAVVAMTSLAKRKAVETPDASRLPTSRVSAT